MAAISPFPQPVIQPPANQTSPQLTPSPLTTVDFGADGRPIVTMHNSDAAQEQESQKPKHFDDNLAEDISEMDLGTIAADLIEGIEADISSRRDWIQNYESGMDLLGLKLEPGPTPGQSGGGKNISRVRHPLLLWAVVKGQSMARAELLPAAGPCKVVIESDDETPENQQRADDLEQDLNYYLTVTATEYVPDMDRGLFYLYYGGTLFKKVYRCPIRNRPVSDCVYLPDLIVSNDATDIQTALRATHVIKMPQAVMDQLQDGGFYLDVSLGQAIGQPTTADVKTGQIIGLAPEMTRPKDKPYTVWECYTTYDLTKYGVKQPDDRPIPYRITIDKDSRKVLEIRRNWKNDDERLKANRPFVKYGLVPGFGFLDLGFLHLLGNHTKALTALWRICIDSGMMSTMPAGLKLKGARNSTNEYTPGPGEWAEIDGMPGVTDIRAMFMPIPTAAPSAVMLQMIGDLASDGEKMAGTVDMEVGEGRTNVPVGTIMSMIEQQTQVMAAVHKRLHTSQQEELWLLKELFAENPEDLWRDMPNAARQWSTAAEFKDLSLVPASDPNVPAAMHRRMQAMTFLQIIQMAGNAAPQLFNLPNSLEWVLQQGVGMSDPKQFINPQLLNPSTDQPQGASPQQGADTGGALAAAAQQEAQMQAQTKTQEIQSKAQQAAGQLNLGGQKLAADSSQKAQDRQSRERIAAEREKTARLKIAAELAKHADTQKADAAKLGHQAKMDTMPEPTVGAPPDVNTET